MGIPVFTHLEGRIPIARHEHVAVLYRGQPSGFRLSSFLAEGLERGDLCRYLAPASLHAGMLERLRAQVANLDGVLQAGTLQLHEGLKDFRELRKWTEQVFGDAERLGAPSVRWLEEGSWPGHVGFPMPQFFDFHAILNYQVKHYPSVALCQYAVDETEPHHLLSAIAVHRHLLVEETLVRDNPFYIPAEKFIPQRPEERERDLAKVFREVGFDVDKLLKALAGYGRLHPGPSQNP